LQERFYKAEDNAWEQIKSLAHADGRKYGLVGVRVEKI